MTEHESWLAFVTGCRAWSDHLRDVERIKFQTANGGYVYVSISRATIKPGSFDEVNEAGDVVVPSRKRVAA